MWSEYSSVSFYDCSFPDEFLLSIANGQCLIVIRDSKHADEDFAYDIAMYNSAFPSLQDKRYSGDRTYFFFPFRIIVETIGHRFEGTHEDVVDFLLSSGVSLPDIMNMDTIQRAQGMTSLFGIILSRKVLPNFRSSEHEGIVCINDNVLACNPTESNTIECNQISVVLSKLGWTYGDFVDRFRSFAGWHLYLPICTNSCLDLLGGRLKFHEALNYEWDSHSQVPKGVMEGFVRETIEELGFSPEQVTNREVKDGVHAISLLKDGMRIRLRIHKHSEFFLGIVEIEVEP